MSFDDTFIKAFQAHRTDGGLLHADTVKGHEVFQTSTIGALLEGIYDGQTTFAELARHGDFGLGTFNALDGEMTAIDGKFHQMKSDGRVYPVADTMRTPFAVVMFFDPTLSMEVGAGMAFSDFTQSLDARVRSTNIFYAVKAQGRFDYVKFRAVPRQEKPYRPLVEVVADQPVYEHHGIEGTVAGFRFPDYTRGINVPGYHLHFLAADETVGGHILDFTTQALRVDIDVTSDFHMEVPDRGAFLDADLSNNSAEAIEKVEK